MLARAVTFGAGVRLSGMAARLCVAGLSPCVASVRGLATLGSVLDGSAADAAGKEVLTASQQAIAWDNSEFKTHVDAVARGLLEVGYKKGTKLAVWMTNEVEHLCLYFAAAKTGTVLVALDPTLSADAVGKVLKEHGCRGLVYSDRFAGQVRTPALKTVLPELDDVAFGDVVRSKTYRSLRHVFCSGFEEYDGVTQFREMTAYGTDDDVLAAVAGRLSDNDVVVVPYSAGADVDTASQGTPLTHAALLEQAKAQASSLGLTASDTVVLTAPLSSTGLAGALAATVAGAKLVIPCKEFNADTASEVLQKQRGTAFVGDAAHKSAVAAPDGATVKGL